MTFFPFFFTGYAELMVIPKGSTSVFLTDTTWNYLGKFKLYSSFLDNFLKKNVTKKQTEK